MENAKEHTHTQLLKIYNLVQSTTVLYTINRQIKN